MFKKVIPWDIPIGYKPYMWIYWENIPNPLSKIVRTPDLIELCHETVIKNCSKSFNIVFLNNHNISKYLPQLERLNLDMNGIEIAHRVDLYRVMLLYIYGGVYLDADCLVLRDPIEIISHLKKYDFVGFGCTDMICTNGYPRPSNWILCSRPKSILMEEYLKRMIKLFKNRNGRTFGYHEIGKHLLWEVIKDLMRFTNYSYYHYDQSFDGSRDKNGKWVQSDQIFSNTPIDYLDENQMMFLVFYNSSLTNEIRNMTRKQLLESNLNISRFFKKALHSNFS
jgi:hypothetical protein